MVKEIPDVINAYLNNRKPTTNHVLQYTRKAANFCELVAFLLVRA